MVRCIHCADDIGDPGPCVNADCDGAEMTDASAGCWVCLICGIESPVVTTCPDTACAFYDKPMVEQSERTTLTPEQRLRNMLGQWTRGAAA